MLAVQTIFLGTVHEGYMNVKFTSSVLMLNLLTFLAKPDLFMQEFNHLTPYIGLQIDYSHTFSGIARINSFCSPAILPRKS